MKDVDGVFRILYSGVQLDRFSAVRSDFAPVALPTMNSPLLSSKNLLAPLASAVVLFASVCAAQAQSVSPVLLTINVYDPAAVTITATGADAGANVDAEMSDGIDLLALFTGDPSPTGTIVTSSNLTVGSGSAGSVDYNYWLNDYYSGPLIDLNLYSSTSASETFSTGSLAFTGSLTVDLSSVGGLRTSGTGTIITGFYNDGSPNGAGSPNTPIGYYQIVDSSISAPEPATWMLFCGALALLGVRRVCRYARRVSAVAKDEREASTRSLTQNS